MKVVINLRDFYPEYYSQSMFCVVDEEVAELLEVFRRQAHAQAEKLRYNNVRLAYQEGLTEAFMLHQRDPVLWQTESKEMQAALYSAIHALTPKQRKRLYKFFWIGMSQREIGLREGVSQEAVSDSIDKALAQLRKKLKDFF